MSKLFSVHRKSQPFQRWAARAGPTLKDQQGHCLFCKDFKVPLTVELFTLPHFTIGHSSGGGLWIWTISMCVRVKEIMNFIWGQGMPPGRPSGKRTSKLEWPWNLLISIRSGTLGLRRAAPCYCVLFPWNLMLRDSKKHIGRNAVQIRVRTTFRLRAWSFFACCFPLQACLGIGLVRWYVFFRCSLIQCITLLWLEDDSVIRKIYLWEKKFSQLFKRNVYLDLIGAV